MALDFVSENYEFFLILSGIAGVFLGFNRALKDDEEESDLLEVIGVAAGLILLAVVILTIYNRDFITKYTIVFSMLLGISLIAKPFRKLPLAFALSILVGLGLLYYVLTERGNRGDEEVFGGLAMKWLVVIILVIVLIVFVIGFIQEQTMDILLFLLSWGILIFIFAAIVLLQGITLLIEQPNEGGILDKFPG